MFFLWYYFIVGTDSQLLNDVMGKRISSSLQPRQRAINQKKKHYRRNNKLEYIEIREKLIKVYKFSAIKRVRSKHITCNMVTVVGYAI